MSDEPSAASVTRDDALDAIFRVHNMVMSGGFSHALDRKVLSPFDLEAAVQGFQHFGAVQLAEFIARAAKTNPDDDNAIEELDAEYDRLVPNDRFLEDLSGSSQDDAHAAGSSA